jgi:hypothetical protein
MISDGILSILFAICYFLNTRRLHRNKAFFFLKEVRNAARALLIRDSPYVPRTLQMQLNRIDICRVLRRWNQFIC